MAGLGQDNLLRDAFRWETLEAWAQRLGARFAAFSPDRFLAVLAPGWGELGFGERSARIADALDATLPADFAEAAGWLLAVLDPPLADDAVADLPGFYVSAQCAWVARRARQTRDFDTAADALLALTQRFSAEGDLRMLFELDAERALALLETWTSHPNPHVRRLVSEGTRPRLPLAARWRRFDAQPEPVWRLLDRLKDDASLYVRRSVANNLNDWAKTHPDAVAARLAAWSVGATPERAWLVDHASRTLVKAGHPLALRLRGIDPDARWRVEGLRVEADSCVLGGSLAFSYRLVHDGDQAATCEADFLFGVQPGRLGSKVFKGRRVSLPAGGEKLVEGRRSLANTSGRTLRPGRYRLVILVNGKPAAQADVAISSASSSP